jgi:hypothetical protein
LKTHTIHESSQCMVIIDYLRLFDSSGRIAKLSISQGNIPCNLCPFNIKEFTLKKGVNKNFIIFNPSFYLACPFVAPFFSLFLAFSFFMFCLSYYPFPFLPFFPSSFLACLSYYHTHFPSFTLFCAIATHSLLPSLYSTYPFTHTHTPSFSFLPCLSYYHTHFPSFIFFVLLQHTPFFLLCTLPILSHIHTLPLSLFCLACPTTHSHNLPLFIPFTFFHVATHTPLFFLLQT